MIFPKVCVLCERLGSDLCGFCEQNLKFIESSYCQRCGIPYISASSAHICSKCEYDPPCYEKLRSLFVYREGVRNLIRNYKYNAAFYVAPFLKPYLEKCLDEFKVDSVMPIPLHRNRLLKRGFNQSMLIAKMCSKILDVPLLSSCLLRTKDTPAQMGLNRKQRLKNLSEAFEVKSEICRGQRVLLVDDVRTTGTTIETAAQALLKNKASQVSALTLAIVSPI